MQYEKETLVSFFSCESRNRISFANLDLGISGRDLAEISSFAFARDRQIGSDPKTSATSLKRARSAAFCPAATWLQLRGGGEWGSEVGSIHAYFKLIVRQVYSAFDSASCAAARCSTESRAVLHIVRRSPGNTRMSHIFFDEQRNEHATRLCRDPPNSSTVERNLHERTGISLANGNPSPRDLARFSRWT